MRSGKQTKDELLAIAVQMFAADGFQKTSLRSIAKQAGVSPALMIHHFGTKDKLIDLAIVNTLGDWVAKEKLAMLDDQENQLSSWQSIMEQGATPLNFFRQVLIAGGKYAGRLFDVAVLESEALLKTVAENGHLKKVSDHHVTAILMTLSGMGSLILMEHIERHLGGSIASREVAHKLMVANNEMLQDGIFVLPEQTKEEKVGS
ncbi:MAG: TetR/AcrR family transcriptional regulator [Micrococcales bacterium]|jgi:AcrR family transcriptional regulator|nr:TetR/AcrR family transcriptional regulator [Micrococcales bacterium]MBT5431796.1 TetR/AcrR family transcriptional regulator [Micrococcales bacterium]MBT5848651.1 TetR/AcrR family transcriptional regulator [Micrococcales bacterium]